MGRGWRGWPRGLEEASAGTCEHMPGRMGDQLATGWQGASRVTDVSMLGAAPFLTSAWLRAFKKGSLLSCSTQHGFHQPFPSVGL